MRLRWFFSVFFLHSIISTPKSWGYDCDMFLRAQDLIEKHSVYPLQKTSFFQENVWSQYLTFLNDENLYLTDQEHADILAEFQDKDLYSGQVTCHNIELMAGKVASKADKIHQKYEDLIIELSRENYASEAFPNKVTIPFHKSGKAKNKQRLTERWKQLFVFKRLTLDGVSEEVFREAMKDLMEVLSDQAQSRAYGYLSFVRSFLSQIDPYSHAIPLSIAEGGRFAHPHILPREMGGSVRYATYFVRFLGGTLRMNNLFQHYGKIVDVHARRVVADYSSYYDPQKGDYWVNLWKEYEGSPLNRALVLRREMSGYRWEHYENLPTNVEGSYHQSFLHHFAILNTFTLDDFSQVIKKEPREKDSASQLSGLKSPPERPSNLTVGTRVLALSLRHYKGSLEEKFLRRKYRNEVVDIVDVFERRTDLKPQYPYGAILLDLRGPSGNLNFLGYLAAMDLFLPHSPAVIMQDSKGEIVLGGDDEHLAPLPNGFSWPLVVLVDQNTKRFGELLAASLQERGRALVLGSGLGKSTEGRNVVTVNQWSLLKDSSWGIRYGFTSSFLWTAGGKSVFKKGVKPDISLPMERDVFPQKISRNSFSRLDDSGAEGSPYMGALKKFPQGVLKECYQPLSKDLIAFLKKRSYERILSRVYTRIKVRGSKMLKVRQSFEETFQMTASDLYAEKPVPSCEPECNQLDLSREKFVKDRKESLLRTVLYQKQPDVDYRNYQKAAREDAVLNEALLIAADYAYFARAFNPSPSPRK